jgi:hypothetical protein
MEDWTGEARVMQQHARCLHDAECCGGRTLCLAKKCSALDGMERKGNACFGWGKAPKDKDGCGGGWWLAS